jgi:tetratricopeptide (TPR) repeat protein
MWIHAKEIAQTFKEQGNEYFKGKRYREALGFYTQGIDAKPDDAQLKDALLLNRATCNLELRVSLLPHLDLFHEGECRKLWIGVA